MVQIIKPKQRHWHYTAVNDDGRYMYGCRTGSYAEIIAHCIGRGYHFVVNCKEISLSEMVEITKAMGK